MARQNATSLARGRSRPRPLNSPPAPVTAALTLVPGDTHLPGPYSKGGSRRGRAARRGLRQSQRETAQSRQETAAVSKDRDALIGQRDTARAYIASTLGNGAPSGNGAVPGNGAPPAGLDPSHDDGRRGRRRLFGRRAALRPSATAPAEAPAGQPAPGVPPAAPAPDVPAGAPAPADDPTKGSPP